MFKQATANRVGYGILSLGVVIGLFFAYQNEKNIEAVNRTQTKIIIQQEKFIISQCHRDKVQDKVIIRALNDAKRRAQLSLKGNPAMAIQAIGAIEATINEVKEAPPCKLPKIKDE